MADEQKVFIPPKRVNTDYPVIDTDPHWRRAFRYARAEDWTYGAGMAAVGPAFMLVTERYAPSFSGRGAFGPVFRLSCAVGLLAGAGLVYQRSCLRFYGWTENEREVKLDMREMVDKVKKGEPLYGTTDLTPYMQGVAARNSRFSALMANVVPWANFVNHNQTGIMLICSNFAEQVVGGKEDILPESLIPYTPALAIEPRAFTRRLLEPYLISVPVLINSDVHEQVHMFQISQSDQVFDLRHGIPA